MKKGDRRRQNKVKRKSVKLSADQLKRVHQVRKKFRKNPAFGMFGKPNADGTFTMPPGLVDMACDMAVLNMLKTLGISSQSILECLLPIVQEHLEANVSIPVGFWYVTRID